jgi:predicted nucleotidyltransferase
MLDRHDDILSLRLFGSHARGEADEGSDIDILLVPEDGYKANLEIALPGNPDISIYSRTRLEQMFNDGHLFAWHLFLESTPYSSNRREDWFRSLGKPGVYREAEEDIVQFTGILDDALSGMKEEDNYVFEAGIAHLAMRNLGMILNYVHKGVPDFSRYSALRLPSNIAPNLSEHDYEMLFACRRMSARGDISVAPPAFTQIQCISDTLEIWLNKIKRL